ncbi:unnamed protein product [Hydatigera taeniaeformis]|uniref:HPt domain-containing protein n=1 Tax=Hydatigena taeniaeformis TaxID=6205 RepID=A0A0R3X729_HYDTA|nr:unnamed protein product [Hydatigera taeniaeformis]
MDVLRRFLNEVEILEEFYSNLELEVMQKCEDRIKEASAADETLSYTMFEFVGELSLLIKNASDKDIEFTRLVGAVVNEAIEGAKGYLGLDSMEESEAGEDIDSNAYIAGCSGVSDLCDVSELNLDT